MENPYNFNRSIFFVISHRKRRLMSLRKKMLRRSVVFAIADLEYRIYHPLPRVLNPLRLRTFLIARMTRSSEIYIIQTVRYLASSHILPTFFTVSLWWTPVISTPKKHCSNEQNWCFDVTKTYLNKYKYKLTILI